MSKTKCKHICLMPLNYQKRCFDLKKNTGPDVVAQVGSPSYLRGRDQEDWGSKPAGEKSF
jgi:hypothetical protein